MVFHLIFIILLKVILSEPLCIEGKNNCSICQISNNLCKQCINGLYVPNLNGGCDYIKKCTYGQNYCEKCNNDKDLCLECEEGYYPDEYGGCSYTNNCEISYMGECIKCKDNYILIGQNNILEEGIRICKSLNSDDFKNCEKIDSENGRCIKCNEGYYLNEVDKKCTTTKSCKESIFGVCQKCIYNHYLDKSSNECKEKTELLKNCKESNDGETCSICEDYFYFDENNFCTQINYCSQSKNEYECEKCITGYYITGYGNSCTPEINCHYGNRALGLCTVCKENYYIDINDGKCRSNIEDNEFKNCQKANKLCINCITGYFIDEENMCALTDNCAYSEDGICLQCRDNYHLDLEYNCIDVEKCIHSKGGQCIECIDNYYYNRNNKTCLIAEGYFENCKSGYDDWICDECKNDFYLNQSDYSCYSNDEDDIFYKCARTYTGVDLCSECIEGYYLGKKDNKCSKVEECAISENENKCIECNENYCLNIKNGLCENNEVIKDIDKKFYYKCNRTNEEGTSCEICLEGYDLNEDGLCIDNENCEEKEDNKCVKCKEQFCLNSYFGCVSSFYGNCLECNNILDFDVCSKCIEGFELNEYNICVEAY